MSAIDEANEGTLAQQILRELRIQRQLLARIHQGNQERLVQDLLRVSEEVREEFLRRIPEEAREELLDALAKHDAEQLVREVEQYLEDE